MNGDRRILRSITKNKFEMLRKIQEDSLMAHKTKKATPKVWPSLFSKTKKEESKIEKVFYGESIIRLLLTRQGNSCYNK